MQTVKISVPSDVWGSLKSKYAVDSSRVLANDFVEGTVNIDTQLDGSIHKRKAGVVYNPTALTNPPKDQYEAIFSDGARHLLAVEGGELSYSSGDTQFNSVQTGYSSVGNFEFALTQDRVYFDNAIDSPQVYDRAESYGGVSYPGGPHTKDMGAQVPTYTLQAGDLSLQAGGSIPDGAHTYKVTYVYYGSEESNGNTASPTVTCGSGNNTVQISNIPIGGYGVTARNIYRDNNDGDWRYVGQVANNTGTIFTDDGSITVATPIPTDNDIPPAFGQIALYLDKLWIADISGSPSYLRFSKTGQPNLFPAQNLLACNPEDPITAIVVYLDRLIVFNRKSMGQILGKTDEQFRYSPIISTKAIGCVDNRTIQIRIIENVPHLVWLSDRGFYAYNGQSIDHISEDIENLVNLNIQQAQQQKGRNAQTTQQDFQNGTSSPGIDLTSLPGYITTPTPRRVWDDSSDWAGGLTLKNAATLSGDNKLKPIARFNADFTGGTLTGSAYRDGTTIRLPEITNFTGETNTSQGKQTLSGDGYYSFNIPIIPTRSGTLTNVRVGLDNGGSATVAVHTDNAGQPSGTIVGSTARVSANDDDIEQTLSSLNAPLTVGVKYWIVFTPAPVFGAPGSAFESYIKGNQLSGGAGLKVDADGFNNPVGGYDALSPNCYVEYDFTMTPIADSGGWVSPSYDSYSDSIADSLAYYAIFAVNANHSYTFQIEASDDPSFIPYDVVYTDVRTSAIPAGGVAFSSVNKRYWRLRITMETVDNRFNVNVNSAYIAWSYGANEEALFESAVIDATDVVSYDTLDVQSTLNGQTATVTIATSSDGISFPDGYVTFGTQVTRRYFKIKAELNGDDQTLPSISSITIEWTITANLISSAIDTGLTPAGWGIFQSESTGTVVFEMRSATTLGGLTSATFYTVSNGAFPPATVVPYQYVQWRVTLTSQATSVATVDSITINWLISEVESIRAASIFHDRRYFCAVAERDETTNNVVFELDGDGNWREHSGLSIATFGFFYNDPYYGSALIGKLYKFLEGFKDDGTTNIPIEIRTKAYDFTTERVNNRNKLKTAIEFWLVGKGTGATYSVSFSPDKGKTFYPMIAENGTTSFVSINDEDFEEIFTADHSDGNIVSGRSLMYKITTNDAYDIEVSDFHAYAFVDDSKPVVTG